VVSALRDQEGNDRAGNASQDPAGWPRIEKSVAERKKYWNDILYNCIKNLMDE
jgi:hypothetical protein